MRLDRPSARDLLDRATELRAAIDWRRAALLTNDPHVDRIATAVKVVRMEHDLARCEHLIIVRAKAIAIELKRAAKGEQPCRTFRTR
jgi:hypothetical protein